MHELDAGERSLARRLLARPTDAARDGPLALEYGSTPARHVCDATMCYWWVTTGRHAPPLADRNRNRIPDWVETTRRTLQTAWWTEVGRFGFRRPLSDVRARNHGPNGKLDIYLGDVGANGVYGYCSPDDPDVRTRRSVAAYCVLDDDFSRRQFGGGATGERALKATAAHELFHAVQFAYDWREDAWLMEGTATWIEDEVFPGIDDNFQYLRTSALGASGFRFPLDILEPRPGRAGAGHAYGAWVFWRYLSERFGRNAVRGVLTRARGRPYAIRAMAAELAARGVPFRSLFRDFAVANLFP